MLSASTVQQEACFCRWTQLQAGLTLPLPILRAALRPHAASAVGLRQTPHDCLNLVLARQQSLCSVFLSLLGCFLSTG